MTEDEEGTKALLAAHYRAVGERFAERADAPDCPGYAMLRRSALGEPLPPVVESHLAACERCRRSRELIRQGLASEAPRPRRAPRLLAPALAGLAVAALLLVLLLPRLPRPGGEADVYSQFLAATSQEDLRATREQLEARWSSILADGPATVRSAGRGEGSPDGESFLPGDRIPFRGQPPPGGGRRRYQLLVDRVSLARDLTAPRYDAPPPPGGWQPGPHSWDILADHHREAGSGEFGILGGTARRLLERAERELRREPLRLAAAYYLFGLEGRARALVDRQLPGLPEAEQERQRARFELDSP